MEEDILKIRSNCGLSVLFGMINFVVDNLFVLTGTYSKKDTGLELFKQVYLNLKFYFSNNSLKENFVGYTYKKYI